MMSKTFLEKYPEFKVLTKQGYYDWCEESVEEILDKHFVRRDKMTMFSLNPETGLPFEAIEKQKVKEIVEECWYTADDGSIKFDGYELEKKLGFEE